MDTGITGYKRLKNPEEKKLQIKKRKLIDIPNHINALLVDGVTAARRLEHHMLESIGIRTEPAYNAQEAIQLLLTGVKFDFIFVDFDLSIINGPELVRQMRAMGVQSKVVGMLTNFNDHNVQMFHEARANASIQKPLTRESFEIITGILRYI
ncbi:two-component response regulator ORR42-like [Trifolium pratense]|uniref:two-component response regulator ORR42-like n=1 Tax=Trifolium pratense TaxID=57577 RepID=UPI001E695659|nr:two-component response regulator ORR42-like [Trifolium pratense]